MSSIRNIIKVLNPGLQKEGGGFLIRRPVSGNSEVGNLFLLFDHLDYSIKPGAGFPGSMHPHRGFETVTYSLQGDYKSKKLYQSLKPTKIVPTGTLLHTCMSGVEGTMYPGDAQWMTAGRGVVHGGDAEKEFKRTGGALEGFQIWVNLPKVSKMVPPRYQDIRSADIPVVAVPGGQRGSSVKIISGQYGGSTGACSTLHPVGIFDVRLQPGDSFTLPTNSNHVAFIYVYRGSASFGDSSSSGGSTVVSQNQGSHLSSGSSIHASVSQSVSRVAVPAPHQNGAEYEQAGAAFMVLIGEPINEPLARHGPFVMNTREEIMQCFEDYQSGRMAAESRTEL